MSGFGNVQRTTATLLTVLLISAGCQFDTVSTEPAPPRFAVEYEKYTLDNGLEVVLHLDRSDPIVAVAMTYHVGSARERTGRTGFAHLFEHLMFLDSENLGPGGLDILIDKLGGTLNGSTSRDRTNYYQVVPNDGLEKVLWAEADKLGYFINTVTEEVVAKEKQVVKNEKRQSYDNQPYGHTSTVIGEALYPEGHPYSWQVIGSLADLDSATLADVHQFHNLWYAPNNATLAIAGDFDVDQTKAWVEKYFGEIPPSDLPEPEDTGPVALPTSPRLLHEDNFATVPELRLTWPGVPAYHPDSYALDMLTTLLADGKQAPLYNVIVEEQMLAPSVSMNSSDSELAGEITLRVRGFAGTDLDDVRSAIRSAFERFEANGVREEDLDRVRARRETGFYTGLSSVLGKAFELAQYNIFAGSPGYIEEDIARILAVAPEDVVDVYDRYVRGRNHVATSFVPRGGADLALSGSSPARVMTEPIVAGAEAELVPPTRGEIERTPSSFDRSEEPPFGPPPTLPVPAVWTHTLSNQARVFGIENDELPLVRFTIRLEGGLLLDNPDRVGTASLVARMLTEGTANRTPEELEKAIDALGSSISVSAGRESFTLSATTLRRNFDATMDLAREILLEPRWDADEFERLRDQTINALEQQAGQPTAIAANTFNQLLYGEGHILSLNTLGSVEIIQAMTLDDLRAYYAANVSPTLANIHIVGDIGQDAAVAALADLEQQWEPLDVTLPDFASPAGVREARLYFVDVPGASQSVIRAGALALAQTDPDFYPATVMNLRLGGAFTSELNQVLREQRGYTYGASSGFNGSTRPGPFIATTSVRSNVTFDSVMLIRDILAAYPETFDESDLEATRNYMIRSNARAFETPGDQIGMLTDISVLGMPVDYVSEREAVVRDMDVERVRELARRYADPGRLIYLVVGDAETQMAPLSNLGFGEPVLLKSGP